MKLLSILSILASVTILLQKYEHQKATSSLVDSDAMSMSKVFAFNNTNHPQESLNTIYNHPSFDSSNELYDEESAQTDSDDIVDFIDNSVVESIGASEAEINSADSLQGSLIQKKNYIQSHHHIM
jgi:hypothetical protein